MALENRAAVIPAPGKPLELIAVEASHPATGEVLIRNHAVAVQPLDAKMLLGGYAGAGALGSYPAMLGTGGAGVIEEVGQDVEGFAVGDRVVFDTRAYVNGDANRREGTWQQLVVSSAKTVAKVCSKGDCEVWLSLNHDRSKSWLSSKPC
jgi:NADPH:quinone reductase-like Zn-dependent oxidoreductase